MYLSATGRVGEEDRLTGSVERTQVNPDKGHSGDTSRPVIGTITCSGEHTTRRTDTNKGKEDDWPHGKKDPPSTDVSADPDGTKLTEPSEDAETGSDPGLSGSASDADQLEYWDVVVVDQRGTRHVGAEDHQSRQTKSVSVGRFLDYLSPLFGLCGSLLGDGVLHLAELVKHQLILVVAIAVIIGEELHGLFVPTF